MLNMYSQFATSYQMVGDVCYIDGVAQESTIQCTGDSVFAFIGFVIGILVLIGVLLVLFFIFWVLALIHALQHEDIPDRTLWLVILVSSFVIGFIWLSAPFYYFVVMRPYKKRVSQNTSVVAVAPPPLVAGPPPQDNPQNTNPPKPIA